jgi:hypothetical protein
MGSIKKLALAVVAGATLMAPGAASADHATRDLCAGLFELDGCWYCTFQDSPFGSDPTNCHNGFFGYSWERCTVWVNGLCVEGAVTR